MKIHILKSDQKEIENYKRITVSDDQINLSEISDNECSFILANDVLDSFSVENIGSLITSIIKKLRIKGAVVIGGTDIRLFSKNVINGTISGENAAKIIGSLRSMTTLNDTQNIIKSLGLNIDSTQISGIHYEIKATRG
jgi:predicted SAM-dependent methyltransferase